MGTVGCRERFVVVRPRFDACTIALTLQCTNTSMRVYAMRKTGVTLGDRSVSGMARNVLDSLASALQP